MTKNKKKIFYKNF